jgi:hypothetical protein
MGLSFLGSGAVSAVVQVIFNSRAKSGEKRIVLLHNFFVNEKAKWCTHKVLSAPLSYVLVRVDRHQRKTTGGDTALHGRSRLGSFALSGGQLADSHGMTVTEVIAIAKAGVNRGLLVGRRRAASSNRRCDSGRHGIIDDDTQTESIATSSDDFGLLRHGGILSTEVRELLE